MTKRLHRGLVPAWVHALSGRPVGNSWLTAVSALCLSACAGATTDRFDDDIESASETLFSCTSPACREFTDTTGTIKVRVRYCGWVSATGTNGQQTATAFCGVDTDAGYALVGGGAEIEGAGNPGALLKESRPDPFFGTTYSRWRAQSSQYTASATTPSHRVRAYSIGLRFVGMTRADLQMNLIWDEFTSEISDHHLTASPLYPLPPGRVLLGGGATVLPETARLFLIQSRPADNVDQWLAEVDDAGIGTSAALKVYNLSIAECPQRSDGSTWGCVANGWTSNFNRGTTIYIQGRTALPSAPEPNGTYLWMMTGAGAESWTDNALAPRFVTDILPTYIDVSGNPSQGVTSWTKNAFNVASGASGAHALSIQKW